jgi:ferritin
MINKKVEKLMNEQIVNEQYSAWLYLSMAAYFSDINLKGIAQWLRAQAKEEEVHALKFYNHIIDRCGRVVLGAIEEPPVKWASPLAAFKAAYEHEVKVTGLINKIVKVAKQEEDYASDTLLQWFTNEQIEEEAQTDEIVKSLELIGDKGASLLVIDHHLGKREG